MRTARLKTSRLHLDPTRLPPRLSLTVLRLIGIASAVIGVALVRG
jgi:hypothetical protein